MKFINHIYAHINRIAANHKILFYTFLGILMFTNTILLFTEPMNVPAKFAFILLPLGVQMFLLAAINRPGLIFLILLPKSILDAFQLVLIKLYGGSIIAVDMFLNVVTTNPSEAGELLSNIAPVIIFLLIIYIPAIIFSVRSLKKNSRTYEPFMARCRKTACAITLVGFVFFCIAQYSKNGFYVKYDLYPLNVMYNLDFAVKKWEKIANVKETSREFSYNAHRENNNNGNDGKREIYVLVIGETARAENWGLYGYTRKTTPHLDTLQNLVVFRDALTQSNTTHKSVPMLLTPSDADDHELLYRCKSVVTLFKEAGFRTAYLTNHSYRQTFMENYFNEADIAISFKDENNDGYDYAMADSLESILRRDTLSNLFVVMHIYGSHFNYHQRYNKNFAKFVPDIAEVISPKYKQELINSYDNTILSTDFVLNGIIEKIRRENVCSTVLYASDHGEDLMDDRRKRFLHASPIPTFYQLHVPFVIWFSDSYKTVYANRYNSAVSNSETPVSTNRCIFHTLGNMAGISSEYLDESLSVCSDNFRIEKRKYLTDHDGSIPIDELLLTKYDYEQFKTMGITLH